MTRLLRSDEALARVRALLRDAEWNETTIARQYGIKALVELEHETARRPVEPLDRDAAGALTALFIEGAAVDRSVLASLVGSDAVAALEELGLFDPATSAATVALYPVHGVYVASDRWNHPDGSPFQAERDVVYPSLTTNADRFLSFMPPFPRRSVLDLCGGTGIGALLAAKLFAARATTADILPRATELAAFNAALNGLEQVNAFTGDLYRAVEGQEFDLIAVHPPYVPALRPQYVFQDGGEDGEQIVRRAIGELPRHLAPGGMFYLLAMLSDRAGDPVEQRIRRWLGNASPDYDVLVFPMHSVAPEDYAARAVHTSSAPGEDYRTFLTLLREWQVEQLVYCAVYLQRRVEDRDSYTVRRQASLQVDPANIFRQLRTEAILHTSEGTATLLKSYLTPNPDITLQAPHKLRDEGWEMLGYILNTRAPFSMDANVDPWMVHLIALADGQHTAAELYSQLISEGTLPVEAPMGDYARAVAALVSGGFLDFRLPSESDPHDG